MWLHRLNCWNTMPSSERMRRTCGGSAMRRSEPDPARAISSPAMRTVPELGISSMLMQRSSVDLPEPDEPMRATTSPSRAVSVTPLSTSSEPKALWISSASMTGTAPVDLGGGRLVSATACCMGWQQSRSGAQSASKIRLEPAPLGSVGFSAQTARAADKKHPTRKAAMNWNQIEGNWEQFKGKVQSQWGKLTGDDLDVINGKRKELTGKIQERYGKAQEEAEREVDEWLGKH